MFGGFLTKGVRRMRNRLRGTIALFVIIVLVFTGCSGKSGSENEAGVDIADSVTGADKKDSSGDSSAAADTKGTDSSGASSVTTPGSEEGVTVSPGVYGSSTVQVNTEFTARDLKVGYEDSTATHIQLDGSNIQIDGKGASADGSVLTIQAEGTYVLSGSLTEGRLIVDAGDQDKIHLIFKGITITCKDQAPVLIRKADKVFITLAKDTDNTLTDGAKYARTEEDSNVDGVIFSRADLTLNGEGTLNINGNYKHGIVSKDDLVITGGNYNITADKDALNGKDCVKIRDGTFLLSSSSGDGIQSKNDDDNTKGYVYISGGSIKIVKSNEGIEGTVIVITGGDIHIISEDDALNAASGTSASTRGMEQFPGAGVQDARFPGGEAPKEGTFPEGAVAGKPDRGGFGGGGFGMGGGPFENDPNCFISISGGTITLDAKGDGIDSNGSLAISGGIINVSGPTNSGNGALDYTGTAEISGGTVAIAGSTGMAQGFSESSTQYSIMYNSASVIAAGSEIALKDKDGKTVISYTPGKLYQNVIISSPELKEGATYTLICGELTEEITISSIVTSIGSQGAGFGGFGGFGGRGGMRPPVQR